jgi:hypothetical protein
MSLLNAKWEMARRSYISMRWMRRAEKGAKIFGVFHVKNHDFTPKNHIFSNLDPPL